MSFLHSNRQRPTTSWNMITLLRFCEAGAPPRLRHTTYCRLEAVTSSVFVLDSPSLMSGHLWVYGTKSIARVFRHVSIYILYFIYFTAHTIFSSRRATRPHSNITPFPNQPSPQTFAALQPHHTIPIHITTPL